MGGGATPCLCYRYILSMQFYTSINIINLIWECSGPCPTRVLLGIGHNTRIITTEEETIRTRSMQSMFGVSQCEMMLGWH